MPGLLERLFPAGLRMVVCHLTRMQHGCICAAGLRLDTNSHVRPIPSASARRGRLTLNDLRQHGGSFELGAEIVLNGHKPIPSPPEMEDVAFTSSRFVRVWTVAELWERLEAIASESLLDIFGQDLELDGKRATVAVDSGQASLGILRPSGPVRLIVTEEGKLRVRIREDDKSLDLPLTDLRFYQSDLVTPRMDVAEATEAKFREGAPALLAVGLTRPYSPGEGVAERHWLQVNNIHLPR